MKKFNKKTLLVLIAITALFVLTGCQRNTDANGITLAEKVISLSTPWKNAMNEGFLSAIFVWPLAQLINLSYSVVNSSFLAIVITTILFTVITLPMMIKSTVSTQKMQMMQPELLKIQAKYEGKTDDASKMAQAQEMQNLYNKNGINPLGAIITPFMQFPILIAMYYAVQRADAVVNGTFGGQPMSTTPAVALKDPAKYWPFLVIFVLMIVCQFVSSKIPMWLAEKKRKSAKGYKAYADQGNPQAQSTNMMMIAMILMVAFIGYRWPIAMSMYWFINSLANTVKTLFIQWRYIDHE